MTVDERSIAVVDCIVDLCNKATFTPFCVKQLRLTLPEVMNFSDQHTSLRSTIGPFENRNNLRNKNRFYLLFEYTSKTLMWEDIFCNYAFFDNARHSKLKQSHVVKKNKNRNLAVPICDSKIGERLPVYQRHVFLLHNTSNEGRGLN